MSGLQIDQVAGFERAAGAPVHDRALYGYHRLHSGAVGRACSMSISNQPSLSGMVAEQLTNGEQCACRLRRLKEICGLPV